MRIKISNSASVLLFIAVIVLASLGCVGPQGERPGPLRNESKAIAIGNATMVNAQVVMGIGKLTLEGGAKDLLDANFIYNIPSWNPQVNYSISDGVGNLKVSQPSNPGIPTGGNISYDWTLRLNNNIPINLRTTLGTGESTLKLGDMSLTGLSVQSGAGNVTLDLSGNWKSSLNASIEAGVGNLALVLPKDTGTIVSIEHGIGSVDVGSGIKSVGNTYINDAYGKSKTSLMISVKAGVGNIRLAVSP